METIQNPDPELTPPELPQDNASPVDVPYGQPIEEPQPTDRSIVKDAFKYLLRYIGLVILGVFVTGIPAIVLFLVLSSFVKGHGDLLKDWVAALVLAGAQLVPLYVFWKKKWCDFSWVKMPNLGKILLWIVVAWLGYLCIDAFVVEVYTWIGIDVDAQKSISEEGAIPLTLISCCILAPLTEEAFYRGAFERKLLEASWNPWYAIVISAAVFGLMHCDPYVSTLTFGAGLLMGWIYFRTRNIWLTVFLHFINNTFSSVTDLLNFEDPFLDGKYPFYVYVLLLVAGVVLICFAARAIGKIMTSNERVVMLNDGGGVGDGDNDPSLF